MDSTQQPPNPFQQIRKAQHRLLKLLVEKIMMEALKISQVKRATNERSRNIS